MLKSFVCKETFHEYNIFRSSRDYKMKMWRIIFLCEGQNSSCSYWKQCLASYIFQGWSGKALKSCPNSYNSFEECFPSEVNEYAPKKAKWVRGNNKSHINKFLWRAIMKRSKLKNKANKTKHPVDIKIYKKQRNYVVGLNK